MDQNLQDVQAQLDKQAQSNIAALEQALNDDSLIGKRLEVDLIATKQVIDEIYLARVRDLLGIDQFSYKEHKSNIVGGMIVISVKIDSAKSEGILGVLKLLKERLKPIDDLLVGPPRLIIRKE
jgi:hypothetical protein